MAEVTWYVLPQLKKILQNLQKHRADIDEPIYLIHLLTTYADGVQKYGSEYFTDLDGILSYFGLNYLECGYDVGGKEYDSESRGDLFCCKSLDELLMAYAQCFSVLGGKAFIKQNKFGVWQFSCIFPKLLQ